MGERLGDHVPKCRPQPLPGDLRLGHEGVEAFFGNVSEAEKSCEASADIGCFGAGKRDDDRHDGVDEPDAAFVGFSGIGELIFELCEDVV